MNGSNAGTTTDKQLILKGVGLALLATLLWSGNFIVARGLYKTVSPITLAFFRWLIATLVLLPIAARSVRRDWQHLRAHLGYLSLAALTGITLFNTLIYVAGKYAPAMNLALIGTTSAPIFVLLISGLLLRQKLSGYQIGGAGLCVAGILLLLTKGDLTHLAQFRLTADDLWIFGAALAFAIYTVLVRRMPKTLSSLSFLFAVFFLGTLLLLPAYLLERGGGKTFEWNGKLVGVFLYLGIGASVISFLSWNISIKLLGAPRTALFGNLIPVFSTIEAVLILGENFTIVTLLSLLIILAGLTLANVQLIQSFMARRKSQR